MDPVHVVVWGGTAQEVWLSERCWLLPSSTSLFPRPCTRHTQGSREGSICHHNAIMNQRLQYLSEIYSRVLEGMAIIVLGEAVLLHCFLQVKTTSFIPVYPSMHCQTLRPKYNTHRPNLPLYNTYTTISLVISIVTRTTSNTVLTWVILMGGREAMVVMVLRDKASRERRRGSIDPRSRACVRAMERSAVVAMPTSKR